MHIDNITPLILHVTAKDNVSVDQDLNSTPNKSLVELINDEEKKNQENEDNIGG